MGISGDTCVFTLHLWPSATKSTIKIILHTCTYWFQLTLEENIMRWHISVQVLWPHRLAEHKGRRCYARRPSANTSTWASVPVPRKPRRSRRTRRRRYTMRWRWIYATDSAGRGSWGRTIYRRTPGHWPSRKARWPRWRHNVHRDGTHELTGNWNKILTSALLYIRHRKIMKYRDVNRNRHYRHRRIMILISGVSPSVHDTIQVRQSFGLKNLRRPKFHR